MRYLSSISLAIIVLTALACTATPNEPMLSSVRSTEVSLSGTTWDFVSKHQGEQVLFQYKFFEPVSARCVGVMCPPGDYFTRWQLDEIGNGQRFVLDTQKSYRCNTVECPTISIKYEGTRIGDSMSGTASNSDGESWTWTATRSE